MDDFPARISGPSQESISSAVTFLFVPGDRPDRVRTAQASSADIVIFDLEDGVDRDAKASARVHMEHLRDERTVVRINAPGTVDGEADIAAAARARIATVMVPKATPSSLRIVRDALPDTWLIPLIETASSLYKVRQIATFPGTTRLALGNLDLAADLGADPRSAHALLLARLSIVQASVVGGLPAPIDGVSVEVRDDVGPREEARSARRIGYGGKLLIHPSQIVPVRDGFRPTAEEVVWARSVLSAGPAVSIMDGAMVDPPVRRRAQSVLSRADEEY